MNPKALFNITYGLYVLSARENDFDNACIINTAVQVANDPVRISISVIKQNKTCEMIRNTGVYNLSAITTEADFALFPGLKHGLVQPASIPGLGAEGGIMELIDIDIIRAELL